MDLQGSLLPVGKKSKLKNEFRIDCSLQATCIKILKAIIASIELQTELFEGK